jgi:hypothetical protein
MCEREVERVIHIHAEGVQGLIRSLPTLPGLQARHQIRLVRRQTTPNSLGIGRYTE